METLDKFSNRSYLIFTETQILHTAALERIQHHYLAYREENRADRAKLEELEKPYQAVLSRLSTEDVQAIHDYHEHFFYMGANAEIMLYRCGVLDGLRLAKYLMTLE